MKNEYIAVVRDAEKVIQEIACTHILMNNIGGTQICGYIDAGSIVYETTLAVIPPSLMVMIVSFPPVIQTSKESIEAFTQ